MANEFPAPDPERLSEALSRLRPIERGIFLLSARNGRTNDEIAARLQIPAEAVECHLADALFNLDRLLKRGDRRWWQSWGAYPMP